MLEDRQAGYFLYNLDHSNFNNEGFLTWATV